MCMVILIGAFIAAVVFMGYCFERAGMKKDKRKGDK